jgi:pentatricopeptide repeat protein
MDHQLLLDRILQTVDGDAYLTDADHLEPRRRHAMTEIHRAIQDPANSPDDARALARQLLEEGRITRVLYLSALHVIAASPRVRDYALAARLVGEQEHAALEAGGADLESNLASVDRHRGVLAFLLGRTEVALDYFTRVLERERNAGNYGNVLCCLVRLGEIEDAADLLDRIRAAFPASLVDALDHRIQTDPDLASLRDPKEAP